MGRCCRLGFYSRLDGLDVTWLVDEYGCYGETADTKDIPKYFDVIEISNNRDLYGDKSEPLAALGDVADKKTLWHGP